MSQHQYGQVPRKSPPQTRHEQALKRRILCSNLSYPRKLNLNLLVLFLPLSSHPFAFCSNNSGHNLRTFDSGTSPSACDATRTRRSPWRRAARPSSRPSHWAQQQGASLDVHQHDRVGTGQVRKNLENKNEKKFSDFCVFQFSYPAFALFLRRSSFWRSKRWARRWEWEVELQLRLSLLWSPSRAGPRHCRTPAEVDLDWNGSKINFWASVNRLGKIWQFGITNLITKVALIFADFWTTLKCITFSVKTAFAAFGLLLKHFIPTSGHTGFGIAGSWQLPTPEGPALNAVVGY